MSITPSTRVSFMPHLASLTSLRFFAALAIAIFHLQGTLGFGSPYAPLANGVSFFFVLSGFILAYTQAGKRSQSALTFYRRRVARIWPIHLVTWLFALIAFNGGMIIDYNWWPFAIINAFLLHAFVPKPAYIFSFNSVSWSLSAELFFYIMFPFFARCTRLGLVTAVLVLLPVAVALAFDATGVRDGTDPWTFSSTTLLLQNPVFRLGEFCLGVWSGRLFRGMDDSAVRPVMDRSVAAATIREAGCLAIVFVFLVTSVTIKDSLTGLGLSHLGTWYHQCAGMIFFAVMISVFGRAEGRISRALSTPILVRLGEISFAFYMVHLQIMVWAMNENWVERFGWGPSVVAVAALALSLAALFWRFLEIPARDWIAGRRRPSDIRSFRVCEPRVIVPKGSTEA